jgi:hypothetical protein
MPREGAQAVTGDFSVSEFLARVAAGERPSPWIVERLRRKVEVARRVASVYGAGLVKPSSQQPLDQSGLDQLFDMFLAEAERGDPRSVNTVLKMADGMVPGPVRPLPPDIAERVARLLDGIVIPDA